MNEILLTVFTFRNINLTKGFLIDDIHYNCIFMYHVCIKSKTIMAVHVYWMTFCYWGIFCCGYDNYPWLNIPINTALRLEQNDRHFAGDIVKHVSLKEILDSKPTTFN